jgi:hypothetical protein
VDNKSPIVFAIFGLSDKLFGVNFWFPRILATLWESVGVYYVFKIAKHIAGKHAGIFATTLYGLSLLWKSTDGVYVSETETFEIALIIISFYKCITSIKNKDFFIGGVLSGLAFAFRFSACFGIIAIFIVAFRKSFAYGLSFLIGLLSTIILLALVINFAGISLHDFLLYGFTDNFGTGSPTDYSTSTRLQNFLNSFFYSELILFYPFVIGYFIIKKKIDWLTLWLLCEFIGINLLGMYARAHFKDILPALSLAGAICIAYLTDVYKLPVKPLVIIIWITFFPKILEPLVDLKKIISPNAKNPEEYCRQFQTDDDAEKNLGSWIKANTTEAQKIYVAGYGARVQAYSERQSSTVYFNVTQTKIAKEKLFHDLSINKPSMIVVPVFPEYIKYVDEDIRAFINNVVTNNYSFETCMYGYNIYKLK